jgi:23S rRNA (cytosine1962-C5)-methyltransferase
MRSTNGWEDFELLDASRGERLERWGKHILIRPDPQVIWKTPRGKCWNRADAVYHRSEKGGGGWENKTLPDEGWVIGYSNLKFNVRPTGFKHMGVFPEQAVNWDWMRDVIVYSNRPARILNLFAYTGGATLACAAAGASVCHVDASKGMVNWARDNAKLSGLADKPVRWIVDDCKKFVERELRRGAKYDGIVMDPPSYGRGPTGEVWKLEEEIYPLVELCAGLLGENPLFFLLNSYTTGLAPSVSGYILGALIQKTRGGVVESDEIGLPVTSSGMILPCGSTAIWRP